MEVDPEAEEDDTPDDRVHDMIQQAEVAKARMFANTGKAHQMLNPTAIVDKGYVVVGAHLDDQLVEKIKAGSYVDFGKLIPRDKVIEDEGRMEMYVKNGCTFWMPVTHSVHIGNFGKWEQAFRVFSNIYCKVNPHRAAELIEYNHVIHTISLAYVLDNVYTYDKEFRRHMANFPHRSWAMILQQAWSLRLRDRISSGVHQNVSNGQGYGQSTPQGRGKINEPCRHFNRGKCNYGASCKFEHCCTYCYKFGHGVLHCRKAQVD